MANKAHYTVGRKSETAGLCVPYFRKTHYIVPSAHPTTTSSWLSCIDIGFIAGVARPWNFGGRLPIRPRTAAHETPVASSGGCASAPQTPCKGVIASLKSTPPSSDLSESSCACSSFSPSSEELEPGARETLRWVEIKIWGLP